MEEWGRLAGDNARLYSRSLSHSPRAFSHLIISPKECRVRKESLLFFFFFFFFKALTASSISGRAGNQSNTDTRNCVWNPFVVLSHLSSTVQTPSRRRVSLSLASLFRALNGLPTPRQHIPSSKESLLQKRILISDFLSVLSRLIHSLVERANHNQRSHVQLAQE